MSGTNHVGGKVYHVTNLNTSGPGSFAAGVATSGNVIVFDVGGSIFLDGPLPASSNLSIEGQTAPGGIQVYGGETSFDGRSNIICRFVHFRDGTLDPNYVNPSATPSSHCNSVNLGDTENIIFDHCSFEFAAYNNIDSVSSTNTTIQNCIFADPIAEQRFNCHFEVGPVTFIDNLWANSHGRNPLGKGDMQFINNIVYNYQYAMTTGNSSGAFHWDVVNNYFIAGPSTTSAGDDYYQVDDNQQAYGIGNLLDSNKDGTLGGSSANTIGSAVPLSTYWFPNGTSNETLPTTSLPTLTAANAFYYVVSEAGPIPRDQVDAQVIGNFLSLGTQGTLWSYQTNTGLGNNGYGVITSGNTLPDGDGSGMPDDWKAALGLTLANPAISGSTSTTGYTYLENYLAWKAQPNAWVAKNTSGAPTSLSIDLSQYGNGFAAGSTYTVSGTINGTVTQSGAGGYLVTFTPKLNTSGLGGFNWTVNNGITTMSSTFGVLISQSGPSQSVVWEGDGVNNSWDTSSTNWTLQATGSATTFASNDPVTFNDAGSASPALAINSTVTPGTITFDNNANNYTLSGTGSIAGNAEFVMEGTGSVAIDNSGANTFVGGAIIGSGTVSIPNAAALGSGGFALNGGDLEITSNAGSLSFTNAINVNAASVIGLQGGNLTLSGNVAGNGALEYNVTGGDTLTPTGSWASYTGTLTVSGSGYFRLNPSGSNPWGIASGVVDLAGSAPVLSNRSNNTNGQAIAIGALNGNSTSVLTGYGGSGGGTSCTYDIGALNIPCVFAGNANNPSTNQILGITKQGTSTMTLSGSSSYTGPTTVSAGTLLLTGTLGNTHVIMDSGAAFISDSYVSGSATLNSGGSLYLGNSSAPGNIGTLTLGGGLGISGGSIYYDLSSSPTATGSNDLITVNSGNVNLSGSTNLVINLTNGVLESGTYYLITSSGGATETASSPTFVLVGLPANGLTRQTFTFNLPASGTRLGLSGTTAIYLAVTGSNASLTWSGSNGATWDLNTTSDWSGASPDTFFDLDTVTFDDSDTAGGAVTLSGTLNPAVINVASNVNNYVFSGTGFLSGNTSLVKTGSSTLTIANSGTNTLSGPIDVNAGTLAAQASLGTGTIYLNGGTLALYGNGPNGGFFSNSIVVNQSSTISGISGNISTTTNAGDSLTSANSSVVLNISTTGVFSISYDMTAFAGTIEMGTSTGTLRINGGTTNTNFGDSLALFDLGTSTATLSNRNGAITINLGAVQGGPGTTFAGRNSGGGTTTSTYVVGALNTNNTFAGSFSNGGDQDGIIIDKVGTGNWTLSGTSSFPGTFDIQQGTLTVSGSMTLSGSANNNGVNLEAESGANFVLAGGTISTATVSIDNGAVFTGNGAINGSLVNEGTATVNGGAPLIVNGNFENDGTMTIDGSSTLVVNLSGGAGFVNNGLLDIMDSPQTALPPGYVNNGTILDSSLVTLQSFGKTGTTFSATIQTYPGHTYQLQESSDLNTWTNVGASQAGAGSPVVLTDTNAAPGSMFYQIGVGP